MTTNDFYKYIADAKSEYDKLRQGGCKTKKRGKKSFRRTQNRLNIVKHMLNHRVLFVMKESINPMWEDAHNRLKKQHLKTKKINKK